MVERNEKTQQQKNKNTTTTKKVETNLSQIGVSKTDSFWNNDSPETVWNHRKALENFRNNSEIKTIRNHLKLLAANPTISQITNK